MRKARKILEKDRIRNCNVLNFIEDYGAENLFIEGNSVMVKGRSDHLWTYISSESEEELKILMQNLTPEDQHFAIIEDWMMPILFHNRRIIWTLSCMKLYFPDDRELPENEIRISELSPLDSQLIYQSSNYQEFTSVEYILERMKKGIGLGIYEKEKPVAWILTHDDGAMGFLHVMPDYRRNGYAYQLTVAMIRRLREEGKVPFVHIEEENEKSMNLSLNAGFTKDRRIHWVKIEKNRRE